MDTGEVQLNLIIKYENRIETITSTKEIPLDALKKLIMKKFSIDLSQEKYLTINYYDKENDFNTITKTEEIYNNLTPISEHAYSIELFLSFPIYDSINIDPDELAQTQQDLKKFDLDIKEKIKEDLIELEESKSEMTYLREKEIQDLNNELTKQKQIYEKNKNDVIKKKKDSIKSIQDQDKINNIQKQIQEIKEVSQKDNNINSIYNKDSKEIIINNIMQNINSFKTKIIEEISKIYRGKIEEFIKNFHIKLSKIKSNIEENNKINSALIDKNKNELNNQILSLKKEFDNFREYINILKNEINVLNKKNEELKYSANTCQFCKNIIVCEKCKEPVTQIDKLLNKKNDANSKPYLKESNINDRNYEQNKNKNVKKVMNDSNNINDSSIINNIYNNNNNQNDNSNYKLIIDQYNNLNTKQIININSNIYSNNNLQNDNNKMEKIKNNLTLKNNKNIKRNKIQSYDKYAIRQKQEQDLKERLTKFLDEQFFYTKDIINYNQPIFDPSILVNFFYECEKLNINIKDELINYKINRILPITQKNSDNVVKRKMLNEKFNTFDSIIDQQLIDQKSSNIQAKASLNNSKYDIYRQHQNKIGIFQTDNRFRNNNNTNTLFNNVNSYKNDYLY